MPPRRLRIQDLLNDAQGLNQIGDAELRQLGGAGRRQQLVQQVFPPNRVQHGVSWTLRHVPTEEPGVYTDRFVMEYNSQMLVPGIGQEWSAGDMQILTQFTNKLDFELAKPENAGITQAKIYLVHRNNDLEMVGREEDLARRQMGGGVYDLHSPGINARIQAGLAAALSAFTEEYDPEDNQVARQFDQIKVFVDLARNGGGCFTKNLPQALRNAIGTFHSPHQKHCFFQCISKATSKTFNELRDMYIQTDDYQDYRVLFWKSKNLFPEHSFRLMSLTGKVVFACDGADYDALNAPEDKIVFLLLENAHWLLITDIQQFVQKQSDALKYCLKCDDLLMTTEDVQNHHCRHYNQCDRCTFPYKSDNEWNLHKLEDENLENDECPYCGRSNFYSAACLNHHEMHCLASETYHLELAEQPQLLHERERNRRKEARRPHRPRPGRNRIKYGQKCAGCRQQVNMEGHVCYLEKRDEKEAQVKEWYAFGKLALAKN